MSKYNVKAKDSFNTKWKLFCFAHIIGYEPDFTLNTFMDFKISDELINVYTTEYHQYDHQSKLSRIDVTVNEIYNRMEELNSSCLKSECLTQYVINFEKIFPKVRFIALVEKTDHCYYCKVTKKQFEELYNNHQIFKKAERGWNFEIDRVEPNKEYFESNCVLACYWCNNAKTDEFSVQEFKPIGELIGKTLLSRLSKKCL